LPLLAIALETLLAEGSSGQPLVLHPGKHGYYMRLNISTDQIARQLQGVCKVMNAKETVMTVEVVEDFGWVENLALVSMEEAFGDESHSYNACPGGNCPA
jgi:hypothetical protein